MTRVTRYDGTPKRSYTPRQDPLPSLLSEFDTRILFIYYLFIFYRSGARPFMSSLLSRTRRHYTLIRVD